MRLAHCLLASVILLSVLNRVEMKSSQKPAENTYDDEEINYGELFPDTVEQGQRIPIDKNNKELPENVENDDEEDDWSFNLDCISEEKRSLETIGEINICEVQNIAVTQRCYRMVSASEIPDIKQIKGLLFKSPLIINFIPKFMSSLARNLESLEIEECGLKSIERNELEQFPNLRFLKIQNTELEWLDSNLFELTPKLEYVDFNNNSKLAVIGSDILRPLNNLKVALFEFSGCIDIFGENPDELVKLKNELQVKCKSNEALTMINENARLKKKNVELEQQLSRAINQANLLVQKITKLEKNVNILNKMLQEKEEECAQSNPKFEEDAIERHHTCMEDKTRFEQLYDSCDRNLGSATKLLAPLVSHLVEHFDDKREVDVICDDFSKEANFCEVVVYLSIEVLETKIRSVQDQNEIDVEPNSLIIRHQPMLFLPTNLNEALPGLEHLEVSGCGLFTIERKTFQELENLVTLNLTHNKIVSIASKSFDDLERLTTLDLSFNSLETIEAASFKGLERLTTLILNDNSIKVIGNFLAPLEALEELNLSDNVCINMKSPKETLENIEKTISEDCKAPEYFCCETNNESHVCRAESFRIETPEVSLLTKKKCNGISFKIVTELIIENHQVKFLPNQLAETFPKLQKLVVLNSELSLITGSNFIGLGDLKWIEIRNNTRLKIDPGTFNATSQLEYLDLSSNRIQSLPTTIFKPLTYLTTLILSNNNIKNLKSKNFPKKNLIDVFRIDNNELIGVESLRVLKNASEIDLSGNTCIDAKFEKNNKSSLTFFQLTEEIVENCEDPE